jgi:hypothetical protein
MSITNDNERPSLTSLFRQAYYPELRTEFPSSDEMDEVFKKARCELIKEKSMRNVDSNFSHELIEYLKHSNGEVQILDTTFSYFQDDMLLERFVNMLIKTAISHPVTIVLASTEYLVDQATLFSDIAKRHISITRCLIESNVTIRWINQVIPSSTFRFGSKQLVITKLIDQSQIVSVISDIETLNNVYRQFKYALSISETPKDKT